MYITKALLLKQNPAVKKKRLSLFNPELFKIHVNIPCI